MELLKIPAFNNSKNSGIKILTFNNGRIQRHREMHRLDQVVKKIFLKLNQKNCSNLEDSMYAQSFQAKRWNDKSFQDVKYELLKSELNAELLRSICSSETETRWPMTSTFQYLLGALDIDNAKTSIFHLSITQRNFNIFERIPELPKDKRHKNAEEEEEEKR
ncbi:hypothetical protein CEXT_342321 [Caerostris extrusa]|uniref:Uncharacterized protein n=1 Tax=Caerostris extrusa TaxID=172846 RepID=A0AAV4S204_CAEEX|nr:hypothetical protein CEXT_342321 [Caerostris extrusa]